MTLSFVSTDNNKNDNNDNKMGASIDEASNDKHDNHYDSMISLTTKELISPSLLLPYLSNDDIIVVDDNGNNFSKTYHYQIIILI